MNIKGGKLQLPKEVQSVELLRGIAAAMVCYFHLSRGNRSFLPDTSLVKAAGTWGWTGVEIFFIISGFVIPLAMYRKNYSINNFFTFLKKRVIRIEPPYLISIVLIIILNYVSTLSPYYRGAPFSVDWGNVFSHVAYLNVFTGGSWLNPVYWSLAIEFQYYLLIALTFTMITSEKIYWRILFVLLFASSSFLPLPDGRAVFSYSGYFIAGIVLFQFMNNIIGRYEFLAILTAGLALIFVHNGLVLTCIALATILVIAFINKVPRIWRQLGLISYSLYLIHVPIGGRIINIVEAKINNVFLRECTVFVAFAVCIIASIIFYRLFERWFKSFSGSISYKKYKEQTVPSPGLAQPVIDQVK